MNQELYKTLVILLGDEVLPLDQYIQQNLSTYFLPDAKPLPAEAVTIIAYPNSDLSKASVDQLKAKFEIAINKITDTSTAARLQLQRGITLSQQIFIYIVASSGHLAANENLISILEIVHRSCRANQLLYKVQVILLLPSLFEDEKSVEVDLLKTRSLITLSLLHHAFSQPAKHPWQDLSPVDVVWLIDARNSRGEFMAYWQGALKIISLFILANVLNQQPMPATVSFTESAFFASFGCVSIVFPSVAIKKAIVELVTTSIYNTFLFPSQTIESNEVLLNVKQFCSADVFKPQTILNALERKPDGSSLLPPFVAPNDEQAGSPQELLDLTQQAARFYEETTFLTAKRTLYHTSRELSNSLNQHIEQYLHYLLDEEKRGLLYAEAFLAELVGKGEEYPLAQGPRLELPTNLLTRKYELLQQWLNVFNIPHYTRQENELTRLITKYSTLLDEKKNKLAKLKNQGSPLGQKIKKEIAQLEQTITSLIEKRQEIKEILAAADEAMENSETRTKLLQRLEDRKRQEVTDLVNNIRSEADDLAVTEHEIKVLYEIQPRELKKFLVYYPLILAAFLFFVCTSLLLADKISLVTLSRIIASSIMAYYLWSISRLYKKLLKPIRTLNQRLKQRRENIKTNFRKLESAYNDLYTEQFKFYCIERALAIIDHLLQSSKNLWNNLTEFRQQAKHHLCSVYESNTQDHPQGISLLDESQIRRLAVFLVERELDKRFIQYFGGENAISIGKFALKGAEGFADFCEKIEEKAAALANEKLKNIGIEEILWSDTYASIRDELGITPNAIVQLLINVQPLIQVEQPLGTVINVEYFWGVPDASRSWINEMFAGQNYRIFSHHNKYWLTGFCITEKFPMSHLSHLPLLIEVFQKTSRGKKEINEKTIKIVESVLKELSSYSS
ncbi:MAG: hypothetical protein QXH03_07405 [Candidatus Bathyarchaeia archaeon]